VSILAADIGGTKIALCRVDDAGTLVGEVALRDTPARAGGRAVLAALIDGLRGLLDDDVEAIGVASAGIIDPHTGAVAGATSSIEDWAGTPLAAAVQQALGRPVSVVGDGIAFALGEGHFGAARGTTSAVVLAAGTGIGGGYLRHGRALLGERGGAGHFGHLPSPHATGMPCPCGATGHLEAVASGPALLAWYRNHGGDDVSSAREVAQRAEHDPLAQQALARAGYALGAAASGLANALDPEVVVVTGGLTGAGRQWCAAVQAGYEQGLMRSMHGLRLVISDPASWLSLRGAAAAAKEALNP
jgi:glucokinase